MFSRNFDSFLTTIEKVNIKYVCLIFNAFLKLCVSVANNQYANLFLCAKASQKSPVPSWHS